MPGAVYSGHDCRITLVVGASTFLMNKMLPTKRWKLVGRSRSSLSRSKFIPPRWRSSRRLIRRAVAHINHLFAQVQLHRDTHEKVFLHQIMVGGEAGFLVFDKNRRSVTPPRRVDSARNFCPQFDARSFNIIKYERLTISANLFNFFCNEFSPPYAWQDCSRALKVSVHSYGEQEGVF